MNEISSWSDTLKTFLKLSNEDERIVALFQEKILPQIANFLGGDNLNWLEIGPGDGNKTWRIGAALSKMERFKSINLTICEPSIDWLVDLETSNFNSKLDSKIQLDFINMRIESLINSNVKINYDFISLIQVMYSEEVKRALIKYIDERPNGNRSLVWIDVEDKSGDFSKMRELLIRGGKAAVNSFVDEILQDLIDRRIKYQIFFTSNKVCKIDKTEIQLKDSHWLFPFILGSSIDAFEKMPEMDKTDVRNIVRNYVSKLSANILNIPDISILIFIGFE